MAPKLIKRARNWLNRLQWKDPSKSTYVNLRSVKYVYKRKEEPALRKGELGTLPRDVGNSGVKTNRGAGQVDLIENIPVGDKDKHKTSVHEEILVSQKVEKVPEPPNRSTVVRQAIDLLHSERGYYRIKSIGAGSYGNVYKMKDPILDIIIAAKLVLTKEVSKSEINIWPGLNHINIMPLLEILTLDTLGIQIFIMPLQTTSLTRKVKTDEFKQKINSLKIFKSWLMDVLKGLEYLHNQNLCHLDIKTSNILISSEPEIAIICDFTFLISTTKILKSRHVGMPDVCRPPEACWLLGHQVVINGKQVDMWGFGMMAFHIVSKFTLNDIEEVKNFEVDVNPTIIKILKIRELGKKMQEVFPKVEIKKQEVKRTRKFLCCFLKSDPSERMLTSEAMKHKYLANNVSGLKE